MGDSRDARANAPMVSSPMLALLVAGHLARRPRCSGFPKGEGQLEKRKKPKKPNEREKPKKPKKREKRSRGEGDRQARDQYRSSRRTNSEASERIQSDNNLSWR
ncbi:hypothetical protein GCM10022420_094040 [Streptomyces iranensis]